MNRPAKTGWVAWGLLAATLALFGAGFILDVLVGGAADEGDPSRATMIAVLVAFCLVAFVGALVASRQPRNTVGWMFGAAAFLVALTFLSSGWAAFVFDGERDTPGGTVAAWLATWIWFPAVAMMALLPLLFPDGRPPGPRWRWVVACLVGLLCVQSVGLWFVPGPMNHDVVPAWPDNPLGVDGTFGTLVNRPSIALVIVILASTVAMVGRFRRSVGDERQQLKWMAFAAFVAALSLALPEILGVVLGDLLFAATIALLPAAAGIAMLKYRLYDVDVVIRKTLVYLPLTAVLAATYVGVVVGTQALLRPLTGGSDLAIAVSTLVVAALFLPARSRVQGFVDRRFYRRRYDAQRTLEAFGARLREEVDLVALNDELRGAVTETMQPAHASLWLRTGAGG